MKQSNILLAGALVSNLVLGSSTDEVDQALQRQRNLHESTPMNSDDSRIMKRLLDSGILKIDESKERKQPPMARGLGKKGKTKATGAAKAKQLRGADKKKKRTRGGIVKKGRTARNGPNNKRHGQKTARTHHEPTDDTSYFDDFFNYDDMWYGEEEDSHDDWYYASSSSGKGKGGKGKGGSGSSGGTTYVPLTVTAFQDNTEMQPYVPVVANASEVVIGTTYIFDGEPFWSVDEDGTAPVEEANERIIGLVDGKCTRTDANFESTDYVGKAYCQFTYNILSESLDAVEAQFTAEGPVQIGEEAVLAITGGNGPFRTAIGFVQLETVDVITTFDTRGEVIGISLNPDLDLPASYSTTVMIWIQESVLPDELMTS